MVRFCGLFLVLTLLMYIRSDTMKPKLFGIPDFPINIRIELAELNFFFVAS